MHCSCEDSTGLYNPRVEVQSEQIWDSQANEFFACLQHRFQFRFPLLKGSAFPGLSGLWADAQ